MSAHDIAQIESLFVTGAHAACIHGFRVVQLHAAHGYFLSLLLSRNVNARRDGFAYPCLNFFRRMLERMREVAPGVAIDIRLSVLEGIEERSAEWSDRRSLVDAIAQVGFDIVSISAGFYDVDKSLIYPGGADRPAPYLRYAADLARGSTAPCLWNVAGNIRDFSFMAEQLKQHPNLSVSLGRPLIADPEFVAKAHSGRAPLVRLCNDCGDCHYFSRGLSHLVCPVSEDLRT